MILFFLGEIRGLLQRRMQKQCILFFSFFSRNKWRWVEHIIRRLFGFFYGIKDEIWMRCVVFL